MKGPRILLAHSLKRARTLVLALGLLLGAFQVLMVQVARSIEKSGTFEQVSALLPSFVREMLGPSVTSFMSFSGIVCLGYFHPVVMASLVGLTVSMATTATAEMESGFMDLILSRPLARHWIVTRSVVVGVLYIIAPLALMLGGTILALTALVPNRGIWPAPRLILSLVFN